MTSNLPLVLITHKLPEDWLKLLGDRFRTVSGPLDATHLTPELEALLPQADGLFTLLTIPVTEAILTQALRLRVVGNMAAGVDNIDIAACTRRGIPVGNTPGVLTEGTADLTMAILLAAARGLPSAWADARQGLWKTWSPAGWLGADLFGSTLGIVGMGKIGRAVAKRAKGFNMRVLYYDVRHNPDQKTNYLSLDELFKHSDFISLHVPLTPQTRGLIDANALRQMKSTAILVNTSRGAVIKTKDLLLALQEGWIAGAALDVTDPEPLPPDHPLFQLPNCLITPHIGSATRSTRRKMAELTCENILAGLEGKRLPFCVNPEVYKRS
jgi:glyoxylate reductase